ncbi:hypothetical protein [Nonomuraea fuscirosea]|uniref:hypothetical protein n=1 Tax=Nonomuraea fuscirosea TaxID=1291556 RepID=UPI00343E23F2
MLAFVIWFEMRGEHEVMFIGRTGPLTLGSALALKDRTRRYQVPEERVIVG